ncbi:hypothetical protein M9458_039796, partial [Cirrhinus mrigala]
SAGIPRLSSSALVSHQPSATSGLHSSGYTSSLSLCQAPPSLRFHLGPLSLQLHPGSSCFLLDSSLCCHHPGLYLSSSSCHPLSPSRHL